MKNINKKTLKAKRLDKNLLHPIIPVIMYRNLENQKYIILKDNKNKAGIYR